jgi:hypothetical protein
MSKSWNRRALVALAAQCLLLGAASVAQAKKPLPVMPSPTMDADLAYSVVGFTVAEASPHHMMRPLREDNSITYEQNFGGGGVATGVLLGPIGVAANIAGIKKRTEAETAELNGKLPIAPLELFSAALARASLTTAAADNLAAAQFKPSLGVVSVDGEHVEFAAALFVDHRPAGKKWTGKYVWQLGPRHARAAVAAGLPEADVQALRDELAAAYDELLRFYLADGRGELAAPQLVKFKSPFMTRRFNFQLQGMEIPATPDRLMVRFMDSVFSLRRDSVKFD